MEALRSLARRLWGPSPSPSPRPSPTPPRPFWLLPGGEGEGEGEGRPRGVLAGTLEELREQASRALGLPLPLSLFLPDGTLVPDEAFFGTLPPHTALQALGEGRRWEPPRAPPRWDFLGGVPGAAAPPPPEVAQLSLSLARGHPRGRWRLSAQIRGARWELGGLGPDGLLRELLRAVAALTRALGQALLGLSGALRPLLEGPQSHGGGR